MTYEHVTLCFSLPRSRSQWLAWLYGQGCQSWHDPLKHCESPLDLKARIDARCPRDKLFIADTSALLFHTALTASLPGARRLYVMRPLDEVLASIDAQTPRDSALTTLLSRMYSRIRDQGPLTPRGDWTTYAGLDEAAHRWWPDITGRPALGAGFYASRRAIRIDTPLREQESCPRKTRLLMRYVE